jgi:hypothetical protein
MRKDGQMGLHKFKASAQQQNKMFSKLETTHRVEENICQLYNKKLITRIYRELKKLNSLKNNEPIKKWATEVNITFSKEEIQMAKKHMKKCSPSLAIKEMEIKTTLRFHFTPVRMLSSKTSPTICW